jgi:hypothetical protein
VKVSVWEREWYKVGEKGWKSSISLFFVPNYMGKIKSSANHQKGWKRSISLYLSLSHKNTHAHTYPGASVWYMSVRIVAEKVSVYLRLSLSVQSLSLSISLCPISLSLYLSLSNLSLSIQSICNLPTSAHLCNIYLSM